MSLQNIPVLRRNRLKKIILMTLILFSGALFSEAKKEDNNSKKEDSGNAAKEEKGKFFITAKRGLNIRSEPSKTAVVIVKMPYGAQVNVLEYSKDEDEIEGNKAKWIKLKWKKYTGWAFGYYVSKELPKK